MRQRTTALSDDTLAESDRDEAPDTDIQPRNGNGNGSLSLRRRASVQRWSRLIHAYDSMAGLVLILFFGATGITLNHPNWTLGFHPSTTTTSASVPANVFDASGKIDMLSFSEYLRHQRGVSGDISDFSQQDAQGAISYRGPGYAADVTIDVTAKTYKLVVQRQGLIAVLNDLHKGRYTKSSWGWFIDLAGAVLVVSAVAGLTLQFAQRRRRRSALILAAIGGAIAATAAFMTRA
ncbi:MAG: hypothetical protein JWL70_444 [Acidimicrobiia bacterium]|nr:hypothetical protein [Acidimicrobiia bacterium]